MNLNLQRRLASKLLNCGQNRVWIDPDKLSDVEEAITREDVRNLINSGVIIAKRKKGISRVIEKRRRGPGSIKGGKKSKKAWLSKIRPLRKMLKKLRKEGLSRDVYRRLYYLSKGAFFRDRSHLKLYLEKENPAMIKEAAKEKKEVKKSGKGTNVQGRVQKKA